MRNDGKPLEKTIQLIEETFKDSENTQIFRNHKIENNNGDKREIDVLIKTSISGYDIIIAIECKDYEERIKVEKIEAFESKCNSIKKINRKIFISKNGFQRAAINTAKSCGIELMTANKLSSDYLKNLVPVRQLSLQVLQGFENIVVFLDGNYKNEYDGIIEITTNLDFKIIFKNYSIENVIDIKQILAGGLRHNLNEIQNFALLSWMELNKKEIEKVTIKVGLDLQLENYYIIDKSGNQIPLLRISCDVNVLFTNTQLESTGRVIRYSDETVKAHSINVKLSDNVETELILKSNNDFDVYLTENNTTLKLENLFTYDSKNKELINKKDYDSKDSLKGLYPLN